MDPVDPTLHFSELTPTLWSFLTNSSNWSFSVPFGGPFRTSFGDHFGPHLETISDLILDRKLTLGDSISNLETSIRIKRCELGNSNLAGRARQCELDP